MLNIWPWSLIRENRTLEELNGGLWDRATKVTIEKIELQIDHIHLQKEYSKLKNAYALKCEECDRLLKAVALSPYQRKRNKVKLRRAALLWHKWTEGALRHEVE